MTKEDDLETFSSSSDEPPHPTNKHAHSAIAIKIANNFFILLPPIPFLHHRLHKIFDNGHNPTH
jgi:hypothetical protein